MARVMYNGQQEQHLVQKALLILLRMSYIGLRTHPYEDNWKRKINKNDDAATVPLSSDFLLSLFKYAAYQIHIIHT